MSFLMERYLSTYGDNIPSPEDQTPIHGDNNTITDNNDGSLMPNTFTVTSSNQQSCGDNNMKHLPSRMRRSRRAMNPNSNNSNGSKNSVQCLSGDTGGDDLIVVDDDDLVGGDLTQVPDNQVSTCGSKMLSNSNNTDNCDHDGDGGDDKDKESESGTYTLDKEDPEVEEARRRIDQVFGVSCKDYSLPQSSSCDRVTLNSQVSGPIRTAISSSKTDGELSVKDSFFTRARLAGALNKQQQQHQPSSTGVGGLAVNQSFVRARRSNMSLQGSNAGSDSDSNSNSPGTLTSHPVYASGNPTAANHNQINTNSIALNRGSPLHQKLNQRHSSSPHRRGSADLGGTRSASRERSTGLSSHHHHGQNYSRSYVGSSLRSGSEKGSRNSLNDLEDDSSLKSDPASSESTGSNCGGGGGRSNSEANHSSLPSMRLNRTVALRRAKLGMDTLGVPLNLTGPKPAAPNISSSNSNQPVSRSGTSSRPSTSPTSFVRNDGGRFSLRVSSTSSSKKPPLAQDNHSAGAKNSSANSVNRLSNSSKTRAGGNSADEVSNRCRSPARSSSGVSSSAKVRHALQKSSSFTDPKDSNSSSSSNLHYYGNSDSHHESNNGGSSYREMSPFQLGKRIFSNKPHQMLNRDNAMKTLSSHHPSSHYNQLDERTRAAAERLHESIRSSLCDDDGRNSKGLSPLDNLVIAATLQLSHKLRYNLRFILEDERLKFPADSETRIMIEELLPQVGVPDRSATSSSSKSKDLSNILKNLKKIEQSFELVSLLLKNRNLDISPSSPSEDASFSDQVNGYQDEY
ncbi:uncharacterized protein LOC141848955 [Brevipalpus obovatus]|uniref:uncharacterized protein LOC141848955 n=1 Tax=Brevipalpus obovatus TaxID=246614 RepID=UPI003D9E63C4